MLLRKEFVGYYKITSRYQAFDHQIRISAFDCNQHNFDVECTQSVPCRKTAMGRTFGACLCNNKHLCISWAGKRWERRAAASDGGKNYSGERSTCPGGEKPARAQLFSCAHAVASVVYFSGVLHMEGLRIWAQFVSQDCAIEIQCLGAWEETFWKIMLRDVNYCLNRYSRVWGFMTHFTFFFKIIVLPMCCQGRWGTAAFSCFQNMGTGDKVIAQQWTDPSYPARHSNSLSCWLQWDSQLMHMAFWLSRKVSVQDNFIEKQAGDCFVF